LARFPLVEALGVGVLAGIARCSGFDRWTTLRRGLELSGLPARLRPRGAGLGLAWQSCRRRHGFGRLHGRSRRGLRHLLLERRDALVLVGLQLADLGFEVAQ